MARYADRLQRSVWHKLYHTKRWVRLRKFHLAKQPCCVMCEASGFDIAGNVVDHIVPPRGDLALFWDPKNLQTLCHPHHSSSKQQVEKRGYLKDIGTDGWPVDVANHPVYRHK
jgi:5-methylcytosine-specific restriction protein A